MPTLEAEGIIFDMDGVLIDSDIVYERHWEAWAKARKVDLEEILAIHHGRPALETMKIVAPHLDALAESRSFNEILGADTNMEGVVAFDGVLDVLDALPENRWAIATSAPRVMALPKLRYLGIPLPATLVTVDDVEQGKPAPDPYLMAAKGIGIDPKSCLVIEDAPAGILAGKAAGARVIAVASTNKFEALSGADFVVERFSDLEFTVGERLTISLP